MREVEAEGREFELERFSAEAGWGMPEYMALFWLLGMPDMVWRGVSGGLRGVRGVRGTEGGVVYVLWGGYFSGALEGTEEVWVLRHCAEGAGRCKGEVSVCISGCSVCLGGCLCVSCKKWWTQCNGGQ